MQYSEEKKKPASRRVVPGDKLATIEEFEAGPGAARVGEQIVASILGVARQDMANRVVRVDPAGKSAKLPTVGDIVVGTVESASPSVAQVVVNEINGVESTKEFNAMLSLREDRRRRSAPPIKASDVIRARIMSTKNSIYQLDLDCENCGVIYTVCSFCGGSVVALGKDRIKCRECGSLDERLLAPDYTAFSRTLGNA